MKRKLFLVVALLTASALAHAANESITVYKDPDCGCCTAWIDHLRQSGYQVKAVDTRDLAAIKKKYSVPAKFESCHTAVVDKSGQIIEGHVPATAVRKLIDQPKVKGLAVPGMPVNSPGMGKMDGTLVTVDFSGKTFSRD